MLTSFQKYQLFFFRLHHILALWKKLIRENLHRNKMSKEVLLLPGPDPGPAVTCSVFQALIQSLHRAESCLYMSFIA